MRRGSPQVYLGGGNAALYKKLDHQLALDTLSLYKADARTNVRFKGNRNVVYLCKYHMVWCPKYRRPVLMNGVAIRLKEVLNQVTAELQADILELEVLPDQVRVLRKVGPQFGIHRLVKRCKGRSSRVLRQEFPWLSSRLLTLWSNSYFVATVGCAPLAVIKQCIENQKGR